MAPDDGWWFSSFCRGASIHLRIPWYLGFLITLIFVMLFTVNIEIKSHQSHHTLLSHATWTIWGNASSTQNLSFRVFRIELWKPVGGLPTYRFSWMQQGRFVYNAIDMGLWCWGSLRCGYVESIFHFSLSTGWSCLCVPNETGVLPYVFWCGKFWPKMKLGFVRICSS
jgi:hypothetical protein